MTKPTRKELELKIEQLEEQRIKDLASLEEVKGLLKDADERRKAEPSNRRKWDRVLENLERGLDETKSRINGCEVSLKNAKRELENAPDTPANSNESETEVASDSTTEVPGQEAGFMETAYAITAAPLSDLAQFNLEQVAIVTRELGKGITPENFPAYDKLTAHLEFANQHSQSILQNTSQADQRLQLVLRKAIEKITSKKYDSMTQDEIRLILASYEALTKRLHTNEKEERLKKLIAGGIIEMKRNLKT